MNSTDSTIGKRLEKGEHIWVVDTIDPRDLPECDVLKVDTEGHELDILRAYQEKCWDGSITSPKVVMFEYHREKDRLSCEVACEDMGLRLFKIQGVLSWGVEVWVDSQAVWSPKEWRYVLP